MMPRAEGLSRIDYQLQPPRGNVRVPWRNDQQAAANPQPLPLEAVLPQQPTTSVVPKPVTSRRKLVAALVLLDASLTFENIWPTPAIHWSGDLSIELAACILALVVAHRLSGPPSRAVLAWLGAVWLLLASSRYAEVTTPALYGRDVNLYWDLRYVPAVAAMLARAAPLWLLLAAGGGAGPSGRDFGEGDGGANRGPAAAVGWRFDGEV